MNMPTLLPAALIVAAMLATPAMARESHATSRQPATRIYVSAASGERTYDERSCVPAPRVGAFASQPWDYGHGSVPCEPVSAY
jgi:uncharacterized phage protein gp47/JayE